MTKPLRCRLGFHDLELSEPRVDVTEPKRGPYDPRSDAERTTKRSRYVCVRCGKEQLWRNEYSGYMD